MAQSQPMNHIVADLQSRTEDDEYRVSGRRSNSASADTSDVEGVTLKRKFRDLIQDQGVVSDLALMLERAYNQEE